MKTLNKILLFISLIILNSSFIINSQNLVPNPSFEEYSSCHDNLSQVDSLIEWKTFYKTPDYFNICANNSTGVSIPDNIFGYQCPFSGVGYVGIYSFQTSLTPPYREILYSELIDTLDIGKKYYFTCNFSFADMANCISNNLCVLFTTYLDTSVSLINNYSHYFSNVIDDNNNWVTINSSFIADSAYCFIYIGNMYDDLSTNITLLSGSSCNAYYYVDNVCVSEDSLTCADITNEIIDFSSDTNIINQGNCVNYNINTVVDYDYFEWNFEGGNPASSNLINPIVFYPDTGQFDVNLIAYNSNGCGDTITKTNYIIVKKDNNINEFNYSKQISISPNPFSDKIIIEITNNAINVQNIKLTDMLGKNYSITIIENNNNIEIKPKSKLQNGVYFLNISTDKYRYTNKLIYFTN